MKQADDDVARLLELDVLAHSYPDGDVVGAGHYADVQARLKALYEAGESAVLAEYHRRVGAARNKDRRRKEGFRLWDVAEEARALAPRLRLHAPLVKAIARRVGRDLAETVGALFPRLRERGPAFLRDLVNGPLFADTPTASDAALGRSLIPYLDPWALRQIEHSVGGDFLLPILSFGYRFHPVGQGLFTSGVLSRRNVRPFRWVYDCGSNTKGDLLGIAIAALRGECPPLAPGKQHLDLVVISHFDRDHVNGLLRLLEHFSVDTLLLPYLAPWRRLTVALAEGAAADGDLFAFLMAPADFILTRGFQVTTVLFAPPAGGEREHEPRHGPEERPEEPRRGGRLPETEDDWTLEYPVSDPLGVDEDAAEAARFASGRAGLLAPDGALTAGKVWEFFPYNDAELAFWADPTFRRSANAWVAELKQRASQGDYEACAAVLDIIVKLYDFRFGDDGWSRNVISLFLYAGPLGDAQLLAAREAYPERARPSACRSCRRFLAGDRFGQMMTGDGFLDDEARLGAFEAWFGPEGRLERAGVFQVMHHGSKHNWCKPVAPAVRPLASLFSSDPTRKRKHPDKVVWRAFWGYRRRQIDKRRGWSLAGAFIRPG